MPNKNNKTHTIFFIFIAVYLFIELFSYKNKYDNILEQQEITEQYNKKLKQENSEIKDQYLNINEQLEKTLKVKEKIDKENKALDGKVKTLDEQNKTLNKKIKALSSRGISSRNIANKGIFQVTAYDLSVRSCGKPVGSSGYGLTASGVSLAGHSRNSAGAIAVDPMVIPLGSKVKLTFVEPGYEKYNGTYVAIDTGGAIKGNIIDLFMGDFKQNKTHQSVWNFGRTKAKVEIVR